MTERNNDEREKFEAWYSDGGKWAKAVARNPAGGYVLMGASSAWSAFQAGRASLCAPHAEPEYWEYRWFNADPDSVTPGYGKWTRVQPTGLQTMADAVDNMRDLIASGYRYELRALYAAPVSPPTSQTMTDSDQRILTLATEFTDANDRGDAASEALDSLPDDQNDFESAGLQQASEAADEDYNRTKALLFAAVRERKGIPRTTIPQGWEIDAARAILSASAAPTQKGGA